MNHLEYNAYTQERDALWKLTTEIVERPDEFIDQDSPLSDLTDHAQHVVALSVIFPDFKPESIDALAKAKELTERLIQLELTYIGSFIARCPFDGYDERKAVGEEREQLIEFLNSEEDLSACSKEQIVMIDALLRRDYEPIRLALEEVADMMLC